jgi:hypothetical protein
MNSNNAAVEVALLEIAKDLLQASDDMAPTDPSASAKLAHEAYEIGRDLGIVRNHLDPSPAKMSPASGQAENGRAAANARDEATSAGQNGFGSGNGVNNRLRLGDPEDEVDDDLLRILDRQRAVVPNFAELTPARRPSRNGKQVTFEVQEPRRSGWFGWMRSRDLRQVG